MESRRDSHHRYRVGEHRGRRGRALGSRRVACRQRSRLSRSRRGAVRRTPLARRAAASRSAPSRIRDSLQAFGYYEPAIEPELTFAEACWHARFTIAPGEPVRIRKLDVALTGEAESDPPFQAALAEVESTVGGRARPRRLRAAQAAMGGPRARARLCRRAVHRRAASTSIPSEHAADIALTFDSGARYAFGRTELTQERADRAARVVVRHLSRRRAVRRAPLVDGLYATLADSGYFRTIDVRPLQADPRDAHDSDRRDADGRRRALHSELRRRLLDGHAGRACVSAATIVRFNDRGHQFGINAQLSPVVSEVTANYRMPLKARAPSG